MQQFVEIAVNVPNVTGVFHYHLSSELTGVVEVGHLVEVPFGKQQVQGVVLDFVEKPAVSKTRPVLNLIDLHAVLTRAQISLAHSISQNTLTPLAECIALMLPPGLGQQADTLYTLTRRQSSASERRLTDLQVRLLTVLEKRGPLRGRQIDRALPRVNWRASARSLSRRGLISSEPVLQAPRVKPKAVSTVQLACAPEIIEEQLHDLGRPGSAASKRREAILRFLLREHGPVDVPWVYAESGGNSSDLRKLADMGLVVLGESEIWRDPLDDFEYPLAEAPLLTQDQRKCWHEIKEGLIAAFTGQTIPPFLLHGVTGSGKTELYLRAVDDAIRQGRQAIVLVPEIALTPQAVRRFLGRFPGQVGLVHSQLSVGERYDTWRRARSGELGVVLGPRSALFTPLAKIGLIVLDECHDDSYYQGDPPFYDARQVAVAYAGITGSVCLLGSATPNVTSTYLAAGGEWRYLRLPSRILAHQQLVQAQVKKLGMPSHYEPLEGQATSRDLPPVEVVDMRQELKSGNRSIFSNSLQTALTEVLAENRQAILFLNRRGTATYVFCRDCGHTIKCPRCDLPLTYHGVPQALKCHHCGYERQLPKICPVCKSERIRQYGTGTERVEAEVQSIYPQARTLRWDYETTRKKGAHEAILSHFSGHRADILIGTQMLAKGLDLPLVTLVGVVLADVGLSLPDYRAPERTFQVLTQVAGRAGRSPLGGKVILQTFQPEHYVLQAASRHNYREFYLKELDFRRQLGYPPYLRLVRLEYRHARQAEAEGEAVELAGKIKRWIKTGGYRSTEIVGPVPCFYTRWAGQYRWQIILRGPELLSLLRGRSLREWRIEVNPPSLL